MPEAEPDLGTESVKAFSGSGARPNGKAVEGGETSMQIDGAATAKSQAPKSALQWKLRFERFDGKQPDHSKKEGGDDSFQAFKGGGQTLKAARAS